MRNRHTSSHTRNTRFLRPDLWRYRRRSLYLRLHACGIRSGGILQSSFNLGIGTTKKYPQMKLYQKRTNLPCATFLSSWNRRVLAPLNISRPQWQHRRHYAIISSVSPWSNVAQCSMWRERMIRKTICYGSCCSSPITMRYLCVDSTI